VANRPLRPCATPFCGTLVERGHCAPHSRVREQRRGSAAERGYDRAHQGWARVILTIDPWCRGCGQEKRVRSKHAEHVVPWQQGGEKFSIENGQGCCASCANYKSRIEQRDASFGERLRAAGVLLPEESYIELGTGATVMRRPPAPHGWRHSMAVTV